MFKVDDGPAQVVLKDLILVGGPSGFVIDVGSDKVLDVVLEDVQFSRNTVMANIELEEAELVEIEFLDCVISDAQVPPFEPQDPAPDYRVPRTGLKFNLLGASTQASNPGIIDATVENLTVTGTFTNPTDSSHQNLIEVQAYGDDWPEVVGSPPYSTQTFAHVKLDVQGGILDGRATGQVIGGNNPTGWKRGNLTLNTGTDIHHARYTLPTGSPPPGGDGEEGAGVYLKAEKGYLDFEAAGAEIRKNHGDGVHFDVEHTFVNKENDKVPVGGFVEIHSKTRIHGNGGDGFHGTTGDPMDDPHGIVGGTWIFEPTTPVQTKHIVASPSWSSIPFDHGQGVIENTSIYNNQYKGIHLNLDGGCPECDLEQSIGCFRLVNSFLFGNGQEAFDAESTTDDAILLTPIVHSTLVGTDISYPTLVINGDGDTNADIQEFRFVRTPTGGSAQVLHTKFFASIFQNYDPDDADIAGLSGNLAYDDPNGSYLSSKVYCSALRSFTTYSGSDGLHTSVAAPFAGSWSTDPEEQLQLVNSGANDYFEDNFQESYSHYGSMHYFGGGVLVGYFGYGRPALGANPLDVRNANKGAHQADPQL